MNVSANKKWRNIMRRKLISMVLSVALIAGLVTVIPAKREAVKAATGWDLVWSDEFNGTSLDRNVWDYEIGNGNWGWGNGEVEYYTDRTDNVNVSGGNLQIIAKKENYGGQKYTSGRILTKGKKAFLYGKMEARLKVENGNQDGVWPAFWMMGNNMANGVGWPQCGEIDIMEHANSNPYLGGCLHWNYEGINGSWDKHGSYGSGDAGKDYRFATGDSIENWHTYGLIWDASHMEWQVDGVTYFEQSITDNNAYCFQKEQFFLFNLAIGGPDTGYTGHKTANANTFKTTTMYIDWLRVYKPGNGSQQQTTKAPTTTKTPSTTKPVETVTSVSYIPVDSVASSNNVFGTYFSSVDGWGGNVTGSVSNATNKGISIHLDKVGEDMWAAQAYLSNLSYIAGNTYTYKTTITSDITKSIRVKVVGDNDNFVFKQDDIKVQANVPYVYEATVKIPDNYTGRLDLYFGLGRTDQDAGLSTDAPANIKISDTSFKTTKKVVTSTVVNSGNETTKAPSGNTNTNTNTNTGSNVKSTTVSNSIVNAVKKSKVKIKSAKSLKKKSIKVVIKKVKNATGYIIRVCDNKKFQGYVQKTTKKRKYTIKGLEDSGKHFVKVRAYVQNGKKKVRGKWSKVKKVKVK